MESRQSVMNAKSPNLKAIELLVLDVDGVLTDGRITYTANGDEIKRFHVRDGSGMKYWKRTGRKLAIITGRGGPMVERRAEELGVDVLHMKALRKAPALEATLAELGVAPEHTAVVGDDLTDIPLFRQCGFPVAVADAAEEARQHAAWVTTRCGGDAAVREVIEHILKAAGDWDTVMARYLED